MAEHAGRSAAATIRRLFVPGALPDYLLAHGAKGAELQALHTALT